MRLAKGGGLDAGKLFSAPGFLWQVRFLSVNPGATQVSDYRCFSQGIASGSVEPHNTAFL